MANWSLPGLSDLYTNMLTYLKDRLNDAALMFDSVSTSPTNLPTGTKRWNSSTNKWEKWNGSAWSDMAVTYGISISGNAATASSCSGNAATASTAAACSGNSATATSATTATNSSGTGSIPFDRYENGLRIVRGTVQGNAGAASIVAGAGFTVASSVTGQYTITFTHAFSARPTITVAGTLLKFASVNSWAADWSSVTINLFAESSGVMTAVAGVLDFIVIGPN